MRHPGLSRVLLATLLIVGARTDAAAPPQPREDPLETADKLLEQAALSTEAAERFRFADLAAEACERAMLERPQDAEPVLRFVRAMSISDPAQPELCRPGRCEAALAQLVRFRQHDPLSVEAAQIAAEEGILLSRMQRFEEALLAYERALPLVEPARSVKSLDERQSAVLLWGNSAETAMALGRLDEAIRRYELAVETASYGSMAWQLALYGLGVALDRDGQGEAARRAIARALERDPTLSRLHEDSVFFEPPGDLHYYEGIAHEVAGDGQLAIQAFQRFLARQPRSPHAGRARWHLARLAAQRPAASSDGLRVEIGLPRSAQGRRSPESIRSRVRAHLRELELCYARLLRVTPGLRLELQLGLEIAPAGFVGSRPHVLSSSEPAVSLARCVELAAEGWRFNPLLGGEGDVVLVPIMLSPPAGGSPRRPR